MLMYYNIHIPDEIDADNWSMAFERFLEKLMLGTISGDSVVENLLDAYRFHKEQVTIPYVKMKM